MGKLTDYQPIESLHLPGIGEVNCEGLVVIVGPNSSGKSQLLRDIYKRIAGEPRETVVAQDLRIRKPEYDSFMNTLQEEGVFQKIVADDGNEKLRPRGTYGTGEAANEIDPHQALHWYQVHQDDEEFAKKRKSDFFYYFGRFLVTQLFLDRRLVSLNATGTIDFLRQPPQHDLHALYLNKAASELLDSEARSSFSKSVWPDISRGNSICMKVSSSSSIPSAEDRLDPMKMSAYRQIEDEGDGFRSYAATCVALLLGRRPVCLIDEPELCLHPPQAYGLGRFIGKTASDSGSGVTFVATHSSNILRGVIASGTSIQIIRMTRDSDKFVAHRVSSDSLAEALKKPTVRAESVLDGIFSEAVIVVEADTDRAVYQAAWEAVSSEFNRDIHFSAVGGVGGISDTVALYRTLKIPVCVFADLDLLVNIGTLKSVVLKLAGEDFWLSVVMDVESLVKELKAIPPTVEPHELSVELKRTLEHRMDWSEGDDSLILAKVRKIASGLDRMARLKLDGIQSFPLDMKARAEKLLEQLSGVGLFLVPHGELEGWLKGHGLAEPRDKKWAWSNEASSLLRGMSPQDGDIWAFVREAARSLFPVSTKQPGDEENTQS